MQQSINQENQNLHHLIESLISKAVGSQEQPRYQSAGGWWKAQSETDDAKPVSQQIVHLAFNAPNFSCAFVTAYQFALRTMFPVLPKGANLACLCVSEKNGNSPKAIESSSKNQKIHGEKTFVTCANSIDTLLIIINDQDLPIIDTQNKALRLVQINNVQAIKNPSLSLSLSPYNKDKFLPDIEKGNLLLNDFPMKDAIYWEGDAHQRYSKPFSVLEGLCIRLAMCAHLLKWASVYQWPTVLRADLILQISALANALDCSPQSATTQIIIDSQNRLMEGLIKQIDTISVSNSLFNEHWQRDKICLYMDFRLRSQRLENAWQTLE